MESRKNLSNRPYRDGIYQFRDESFEVIKDKNSSSCNFRALTDLKLLRIKKGESRKLNIDNVVSYLNDELFDFKIKHNDI